LKNRTFSGKGAILPDHLSAFPQTTTRGCGAKKNSGGLNEFEGETHIQVEGEVLLGWGRIITKTVIDF